MARTLESLTRHAETLTSIRGIVHTMKTLSAINAAPYERAATSVEAYHQTILQGFRTFAQRTGGMPEDRERRSAHCFFVFGSDHGLCGNYNDVLAETVHDRHQSCQHEKIHVLCVGTRMSDALAEQGLSVDAVLLQPASSDGIGRLAAEIVTRIDTLARGQLPYGITVTLAFTQRAAESLREPVTSSLLPLDSGLFEPATTWNSRALPNYRMDTADLLACLVRSHIFASVFRASAEAMVTENAARLALMQQAERSVDDRILEVQGELRTVRQTEITSELLDVVVGFEALKKKKHRPTDTAD